MPEKPGSDFVRVARGVRMPRWAFVLGLLALVIGAILLVWHVILPATILGAALLVVGYLVLRVSGRRAPHRDER